MKPILIFLLAGIVSLGLPLFAQSAIPAGTILPVTLSSSLNSRKAKTGQRISARVMQDVPFGPGSVVRRGSKVIGHVVAVSPVISPNGATMAVRFDTIVTSKRSTPIVTNVRALASMAAVHDAQLPKAGPDRGTSENAWTTEQIGGEVVYRGGGPVTRGLQVVGKPAPNGVLVRVASQPGTDCRGEFAENDRLQALWVFSSDACGVFGLSNLEIVHAGRTDPVGTIFFGSRKGEVNLQSGTGMLLRVDRVGSEKQADKQQPRPSYGSPTAAVPFNGIKEAENRI